MVLIESFPQHWNQRYTYNLKNKSYDNKKNTRGIHRFCCNNNSVRILEEAVKLCLTHGDWEDIIQTLYPNRVLLFGLNDENTTNCIYRTYDSIIGLMWQVNFKEQLCFA